MLQPYADLSDADFDSERLAQRFACVHLATAIAGLTLCKGQAATHYGVETLTGFIGQLRDMEGDVAGWIEKTDQAQGYARVAR